MVVAGIIVVLIVVFCVLGIMVNPPEKLTRRVTRGKDKP